MYIASISLVVCLSLAVIAWIREREDSGYWQYLIRSGVWSLLLALDAGLMWIVTGVIAYIGFKRIELHPNKKGGTNLE